MATPPPQWKGSRLVSKRHEAAFSVFQQKHGASERLGLREQVLSQTASCCQRYAWISLSEFLLIVTPTPLVYLHRPYYHTAPSAIFNHPQNPPVTVTPAANKVSKVIFERNVSPALWSCGLKVHLKQTSVRGLLGRYITAESDGAVQCREFGFALFWFFQQVIWSPWTGWKRIRDKWGLRLQCGLNRKGFLLFPGSLQQRKSITNFPNLFQPR